MWVLRHSLAYFLLQSIKKSIHTGTFFFSSLRVLHVDFRFYSLYLILRSSSCKISYLQYTIYLVILLYSGYGFKKEDYPQTFTGIYNPTVLIYNWTTWYEITQQWITEHTGLAYCTRYGNSMIVLWKLYFIFKRNSINTLISPQFMHCFIYPYRLVIILKLI